MADLKSINSVAAASLKSFNGVAAASLKAIAGLGLVLTGIAWEISTFRYFDKYKNISEQAVAHESLAFSADGTKMYVITSDSSSNKVYQYTLSTAWDVSTASYASKYKDLIAHGKYPCGLDFSSDGTKMYIIGGENNTVYQYTLSTAWDVSTASYASKYKDISAQDVNQRHLRFNSDGTKMYIVGTSYYKVYQYTLSTAWDVSTASYASKYKDLTEQDSYAWGGLAFSADGTKMYIVGTENDTVYQYTLSMAWDVSTASYASKYKDISARDSGFKGLAFSSDGTKMYIVGTENDTVYQYSIE